MITDGIEDLGVPNLEINIDERDPLINYESNKFYESYFQNENVVDISHTFVEDFDDKKLVASTMKEEQEEERGTGLSQRSGNIFQAVFNFSNAPLGAGMLSFPYTFYCTGFLSGLVLSGFVIVITLLTLYILARSSFQSIDPKTKLPGFRTYQECIEHYHGKYWKKLSEVTMLFYAVGACMVYFVAIGQFIEPIALIVFPQWFFLTDEKVIIIIFGAIIVFPLLLLKNMRTLWFTSFLAVGCAWLLSAFMFYTGIRHIAEKKIGEDTSIKNPLFFIQTGLYSNIYPLFFLAVPIKCFGYMSHVLLFPITYEVKNAKMWKINLIIFVSIIGVSFIYLVNGISGWYAFGDKVSDNILNNFSGVDIGANIVRFACGLNLLFSFPIQNYGARLTINSIIYGDSNRENGTICYLLLNLGLFFFMLSCALVIPGLAILFSFIGALGAVTLIFFFPSLLCFSAMSSKKYNKSSGRIRRGLWKVIGILLMILGVFFAVTGVIASVFKFIEAVDDHQF